MATVKKVVVKLDLHDDTRKRRAIKAVSTLCGIDEIVVDMKGDRMTVLGTVDPVDVVRKLRKAFCTVQVVSVGPPKEGGNKKVTGGDKDGKTEDSCTPVPVYRPCSFIHTEEDTIGSSRAAHVPLRLHSLRRHTHTRTPESSHKGTQDLGAQGWRRAPRCHSPALQIGPPPPRRHFTPPTPRAHHRAPSSPRPTDRSAARRSVQFHPSKYIDPGWLSRCIDGRHEGCAEAGRARRQAEAEGDQGGLRSPWHRPHRRGHEGPEDDGRRHRRPRRRRGQAAQQALPHGADLLRRPGQGGEEGR